MMVGAYQHQVEQLGGPAVLPVPDVVGVQTPGGTTTGNRARGMAMLQRTAKPPVDQAGGSPGADDLAVAFKPHLTGGITGQISAVGAPENMTKMNRTEPAIDMEG